MKHVFMLSCIKHGVFMYFLHFSANFFPHDIIAEKALHSVNCYVSIITIEAFIVKSTE